MENIKVKEFDYVLGYDDEFDFKFESKQPEIYDYESSLNEASYNLNKLKNITSKYKIEEFNPKLVYYIQYKGNNALQLLLNNCNKEADFDYVIQMINDEEFDYVIPTFNKSINYVEGNIIENQNEVNQTTTNKRIKNKKSIMDFYDDHEKLIKGLAIALGITVGAAIIYLLFKDQEACRNVIARHGGIQVDNTEMIIYPNGNPPKLSEFNEEMKQLIIQDIEYVREYIKNIAEAILGRSL